jgi:diguanylate cyclase (GGDEF)-like protein
MGCVDLLTGLGSTFYLHAALGSFPSTNGHTRIIGIVVVGDIDKLRLWNDRYGLRDTDRILVEVADRLRRATPGIVYRVGGDQFAALIVGLEGEERVSEDAQHRLADQWRQAVAAINDTSEGRDITHGHDISMTVGGAVGPISYDLLSAAWAKAERRP